MKIKKYIVFIIAIIFSIVMTGNVISNAASGSFSVSKSSLSITTGKTATFTITASNCGGMFTISSSDTSVATVSSSEEWIEEETLTVTVTAKSEGTTKITVTATDVAGTNEKEVTGSKTINVTVKDASSSSGSSSSSSSSSSTKSSVATLSNLGITPLEYDFTTFTSGTYSYSVSVPYEAETISIYATATNSNATITGTGSKTLSVGTNTFNVKVTAQDGTTTKTYTLIITREEESEDEEEETTESVASGGLISLEVTGYTISPEFSSDVYEYTMDLTDNVEELDIVTETAEEYYDVEIVGNGEFEEGENVITILVYDTKNDTVETYQIIVNYEENIDLTDANDYVSEAQSNLNKKLWVIKITIILIVALIIIYLIERYHISRKQKREQEAEEQHEFADENKEIFSNFEKHDTEQLDNNNSETDLANEDDNIEIKDDTNANDIEEEVKHKSSKHRKGKRFKE